MPHVPNEVLNKFTAAFEAATRRAGGGKVTIDSNQVRAAVREHREAAYLYVELHCRMAASQPGYLQPAMIVATAYQIEFDDPELFKMVNARAGELHAQPVLARLGFAPYEQNLTAEPPERQAAREWWKRSRKDGGICDACQTPLRRGEGYLLEGRVVPLGRSKLNMGEEILCSKCFEQLRADPREPGAGDDYTRVG